MKKFNLILIFILIIAALVRLAGINFYLIPDEAFQLYKCLKIGRLDFAQNFFLGIYSYIMFIYYSLFFVFGLLVGWFSSLSDFMGHYYTDPHIIYLAGRVAECLAATASVYVIYLLGSRMFNERVGLISAFFLAFNLTHVEISQLARGQGFCSFFIIISLYLMYLLYLKPRLKYYIWIGICIAAASSIRIFSLSLFIPLTTAFLYTEDRARKLYSKDVRKIAGKFILCILIFLIASVIFTIDIVIDFKFFLSSVLSSVKPISPSSSSEAVFLGSEVVNGWKAYLITLLPGSFGWPLYIISLFALVIAICKWKRFEYTFLSSFIIIYILIMGKSSLVGARYMLPIFPALIILGAHLIEELGDKLISPPRLKGIVIGSLAVLLMIPPGLKVIRLDLQHQKRTTQDLAREWILKNIPDRARIAVESTGYATPNIRLYSVIDYDIYRMTKPELEQLYAKRMEEDKTESLALKYFIDHPPQPWHRIYNIELKEKVPLEYLKDEKIEYVVTSDMILNKFNSSINRNKYPDIVKSREEFYIWLKDEGKIIKEFKPSKDHPGPEIKIYKMPIGK